MKRGEVNPGRALLAAVNAVVDLHRPGAESWLPASLTQPAQLLWTDDERCAACREDYPCATMRAVNDALGGER